MNYLGIDFDLKNIPELDSSFIPFGVWMQASVMSNDVNQFPEKKINVRYSVAFGGLWSRSPEDGDGEVHQTRRLTAVDSALLASLLIDLSDSCCSAFAWACYLLVLGRVASGVGGEWIVSECTRVLADEYPALAEKITVTLPDEKFRRVGQSMAAASLPEV